MLYILITFVFFLVFDYLILNLVPEVGLVSHRDSDTAYPTPLTLTPLIIPLAHPISGSVIWNATECHELGAAVSPSFSFWRAVRGISTVGIHLLPGTTLQGGCGADMSSAADPEWQGITQPSRSSSSVIPPEWGSSTLGSHHCCGTAMPCCHLQLYFSVSLSRWWVSWGHGVCLIHCHFHHF